MDDYNIDTQEIPPANQEAERYLLGTLLTYPEDLAEVANLHPGSFYNPSHRIIFDAMLEIRKGGLVPSLDVLTTWLRDKGLLDDGGGFTTLMDLMDVGFERSNLGHHAKQILDAATRRNMIKLHREALARAKDLDLPLERAIGLDLEEAQERAHTWITTRERVPNDSERIDAFMTGLLSDDQPVGLRGNGFENLYAALGGGFTQGVYVLGGAPSVGKTSLAKQWVDDIAEHNKDIRIAFFSFEQSARELLYKTICRGTGMNMDSIKRGKGGMDKQAWEQVHKAGMWYQTFGHRMTIYEADREMTPDRIALIANKMKAEADRLMLVIDYVQIAPANVTDRRVQLTVKDRIDSVLSDYRQIARSLDCPVLCMSSLRRDAYQSPTQQSDDGNAFNVMEREDVQNGMLRLLRLDVIKNRNGRRLGGLGIKYHPARFAFEEEGFRGTDCGGEASWTFKESGGLDYTCDVAMIIREGSTS